MSIHWSYVDGARLIPVDVGAERAVAGNAVASAFDAGRYRKLLAPDDFHDGTLWEIVEVAAGLDPAITDTTAHWLDARQRGDHVLVVNGCAARAGNIADATGIDITFLRDLVMQRWDSGELLIRRLVDVAAVRAANRDALGQLATDGVEVRLLTDIDSELAQAWDAILRCAEALGGLLAGTGSEVDVIDALVAIAARVGFTRQEIAEAIRPGGHDGQ